MRPACLSPRHARLPSHTAWQQSRTLLTLAIETSCDDTSVAILEKDSARSQLHFHRKITSDNRVYQGVHPLVAVESHQRNLAKLVGLALQSLPTLPATKAHDGTALLIRGSHGAEFRKKPDFVTVTRGPGMRSSLATGLDTAKGLSVAWQVPMLGVNHMQAHALTPRLVSTLDATRSVAAAPAPAFPFLTFLVSGGHTMLVHSKALCDHEILAETIDMAIGDVIDKCARDILPTDVLSGSSTVMYGRLLEAFAFPDGEVDYAYTAPTSRADEIEVKKTEYQWAIGPPLSQSRAMEFSFSALGSTIQRITRSNPDMPTSERRVLARETMRVSFEHLISRLFLALQDRELHAIETCVVSGGVASNRYLKHMLRAALEARGFEDLAVVFPPPALCTDNAAMIAWTGVEMWEAGFRTDLEALALKKWAIDPRAQDGGILGAEGWHRRD